MLAGTAADILILAILTALCVAWLRRYRAIHGRRIKGERVLALQASGDRSRSTPNARTACWR
jgi:hypothetical protein